MKKKYFIFGFVILIFVLTCCIFSSLYALNGCFWWECAPQRNFRIADLELPSSLFPDGAIVNHVYPLSDEFGTIDDGSQSVYWDNGNSNAGYTIYRYPTIRKAVAEFDFNKHLLVSSDAPNLWPSPIDLKFSSTTADVVNVACGYLSINNTQCAMVVRCKEYVVFFSTSIDEKMTYPHFEKIEAYIDQQISSRLCP